MKIGVISDTHIPHTASKLPGEIYNAFRDVELILHAGDFVEMAVLDELNKLAKTEAVHGNMDSHAIQKLLPDKKVVGAGKYKIGLIHGFSSPFNLIDAVKKEFPEKVDIIVFGHSHSPINETRDGILFFNPGSPTDKIFAKYNSYGIITVNKTINGEIVKL